MIGTAIMVTHNSAGCVAAALLALRSAGLAVRVVDNASTDGTAALIATNFPDVELLRNDANVGFAGAVNQALRHACADVVLLVNPACVVPPETARALVDFVRHRPRVGIAGPRLIGPDGAAAISAHPFESVPSVLASRFGAARLPMAVRRILCGPSRRRAYDACRGPGAPLCVDWLSGACLAVRTTLLVDVGGLDDGYFVYYADAELCLRAWQQATSVVYLPAVEAQYAPAAGGVSGPQRPHLYRSLLRFFARHRRSAFPAVRAAILLRAVLGIALAAVRLAWQPATAALRARNWADISRIAMGATPETLERHPCAY